MARSKGGDPDDVSFVAVVVAAQGFAGIDQLFDALRSEQLSQPKR